MTIPSAVDEPVTIQDVVDKPVTVHDTADEQLTIRGAINERSTVQDAVDESVSAQAAVSVLSREVPMKKCRLLWVPDKQKCAICFKYVMKSNMKRHRKLHRWATSLLQQHVAALWLILRQGSALWESHFRDRNTHCMFSLVLVQPCSASVTSARREWWEGLAVAKRNLHHFAASTSAPHVQQTHFQIRVPAVMKCWPVSYFIEQRNTGSSWQRRGTRPYKLEPQM